jgi:cytochrome c556
MKSSVLLLASGLVCLGAAVAADKPAPPPNLHDLMKNVVAVQAQALWDVGNNAQDDNGNPDASKLKPADWAKAAAAATKMKQVAQTLATAPKIMAAAPGQKIDGEGGAQGGFGAKQVQAVIDANPKLFQAFAQALSVSMDQVTAAAKTKDAAKLFDVSGQLDQVCETCHAKFWYPDQK